MADNLTLKEIYSLYGDKEVYIALFDGDLSDYTKNKILKPIKIKVLKYKKYGIFDRYYVKDRPSINSKTSYIVSEYMYDTRTAYYEEIEIWHYHVTQGITDKFRNELNKKIDEIINLEV